MKRRTFINSALATAALTSPTGRLLAAAHAGPAITSDINAIRLDGSETTIEKAVLNEFLL